SSRALMSLPSFPTRRSSDLLVGALVILNIGRGFNLSGRLIHAAFLEEGIDFLCHCAMTPSGRGAKQITVIMLEGQVGTQPYLARSEEHTSELQSRFDLVCRL